MTVQQVVFALFALLTVGGAIGVVAARKLFHAALWMVLAFFGIAGLYMLLEAPFFAALQLFIYIGGIAVLIVMAIMVTRGIMGPKEPVFTYTLGAAGTAVAFLAMLGLFVFKIPSWAAAVPVGDVDPDNLRTLGEALVAPSQYLLPFEVASVLLLAVLIGALYVAREKE